MTVILQFLNVDKNIMEYVSVTNVPCVNLSFLLSNQARLENLIRSVCSILERDRDHVHYLFYALDVCDKVKDRMDKNANRSWKLRRAVAL